jgi:hypothetical protein
LETPLETPLETRGHSGLSAGLGITGSSQGTKTPLSVRRV